jgi:four helix bundle protein
MLENEEAEMSSNYRDLILWQRAMNLVLEVYRCTKTFPREEIYGLVSQMRRAAVSIPSNIAEGKGRYTRKELTQFLLNARGSLLELETQCEISRALGYMADADAADLARRSSEVGRLMNGMLNHFRQPSPVQ